jgi:hypothetical protein
VTITRSARASCANYLADVVYFTDLVVKRHTRLLMKELIKELNGQFNNIFGNRTTGLALIVTRPFVREVGLVDDDIY